MLLVLCCMRAVHAHVNICIHVCNVYSVSVCYFLEEWKFHVYLYKASVTSKLSSCIMCVYIMRTFLHVLISELIASPLLVWLNQERGLSLMFPMQWKTLISVQSRLHYSSFQAVLGRCFMADRNCLHMLVLSGREPRASVLSLCSQCSAPRTTPCAEKTKCFVLTWFIWVSKVRYMKTVAVFGFNSHDTILSVQSAIFSVRGSHINFNMGRNGGGERKV